MSWLRSPLKKATQLAEKFIYSKHMLTSVGVASFLESIIVPIPLETILIPLMQARRERLFMIASIALLGCMVGASVGYAVGYFLMDSIGPTIINALGTEDQFNHVQEKMKSDGFWFIFSVGVIPIPFQIAMVSAGALKYSFLLFILASVLSRAIRYYVLALLVWYFGNHAQAVFEKHKKAATTLLCTVIAAAWALAIWG